jgi:hypothetical protein
MDDERELTEADAKAFEPEPDGLRQFATELANRYGVVPESPIIDVEFHPNHRVFHVKQPVPGKEDEFETIRVRTKSNCKKCYGFGYRALFHSNEEELKNTPLLDFCSCLRPIEEKRDDGGKETTGAGEGDVCEPEGEGSGAPAEAGS